MPYSISDKLFDGLGNPKVGYVVQASPGYVPIFELESDSQLHETSSPYPSATTDSTGLFTIAGLPLQAEQSPSTSSWQLGAMPDATYWGGAPPTSAGTYSIQQLINSWGWGVVSGGSAIKVVVGQSAVIGTKAGIPSDADYTTPPPIGSQVLDTTDNRLYVRVATATWKYSALT